MVATEKNKKEMGLFFKNKIRTSGIDATAVVTIPKPFINGGMLKIGKKYLFEVKEEVEEDEDTD